MNQVDRYILGFPEEVREILAEVRKTILENAPGAEEGFSYGMPSYRLHGRILVYFAAFRKHIGFYATPSGHHAFSDELRQYKQGKGSVQFPLDRPIPYDLIAQMVAFRAIENQEKSKKEKKEKDDT